MALDRFSNDAMFGAIPVTNSRTLRFTRIRRGIRIFGQLKFDTPKFQQVVLTDEGEDLACS
jgi:hypothetical protein